MLVGIGMALLSLGATAQASGLHKADGAGDSDWRVYGIVNQLPTSGLVGNWVISGTTYVTSDTTIFEQEIGVFAVGACVKANLAAQDSNVVVKLQTELAGDCDGQSGGGDDNGGGVNEDWRVYGIVNQMPVSGLVGNWVISGTTYVTSDTTIFEQQNGAFAVGACVKANLAAQDSNVVVKLQTELAGDCDGQGGGGDDGGNDSNEVYGFVEQMPPSGLVGSWVVSGTTYTVGAGAEFKQEYGPFAVGVCVKLHLETGSATAVREMETERDYRCTNAGDDNGDDNSDDNGGASHHDGEFFGLVQAVPQGFPATMIGAWRVGNVDLVADARTEFKQEKGPLALNIYVKVEFVIAADGSFRATEIKTALMDGDGGDDNGEGNGGEDDNNPVDEGQSFGVIDALPAQGLLGAWTIGGAVYTVTEQTELDNEGVFAVGVRVKVEYRLDAQGQRIAKEIEITDATGDVSDPSHSKIVGFVEELPANSFLNDWKIAGMNFVADAQTQFEEEHGMLVVGAYVEVEYSTVGGVLVMHHVETRVAPGAGDDNSVGELEQIGMVRSAEATVWRIGGQSYTVTPATQVGNNVAVASDVMVNSFIDRSGARVATRISTFVVHSQVYLSLVVR